MGTRVVAYTVCIQKPAYFLYQCKLLSFIVYEHRERERSAYRWKDDPYVHHECCKSNISVVEWWYCSGHEAGFMSDNNELAARNNLVP